MFYFENSKNFSIFVTWGELSFFNFLKKISNIIYYTIFFKKFILNINYLDKI